MTHAAHKAAAPLHRQFEYLLRITRVREAHARYTVVSAMVVHEDGTAVPRAPNYAVEIPSRVAPIPICQGQRWRVTGVPEPTTFVSSDGWRVDEMRMLATSAELERPSGAHIVSLLSGDQFPGIGPVTAQRVWDVLGSTLYEALDTSDRRTLERVVGIKHAHTLLTGWTHYNSTDLVRWMQAVNLDLRVGRKVLKVYGPDALDRLRSDPYRLLALGLPWSAADTIATVHEAIAKDDPRRIMAAVEAELYRIFDHGDTVAPAVGVERAVARTLRQPGAETAITAALNAGVALAFDGLLSAPGPYLLERTVSDEIARRVSSAEPLFTSQEIDEHFITFERSESDRPGSSGFALNAAQRSAVVMASEQAFFCLIGGAGVGKTTTLNAIASLFDRLQLPVFLLAPTGKASKRMKQATRRPAMTIAGFLRNVAPKGIPPNAVVVVDEASMLDIQLAYRLLTAISPTSRVILIGDPAQLPPVGPGLTLHVLAAADSVPRVELTEGKRFGGDIADVAGQIRNGVWPRLSNDVEKSVSFSSCDEEALAERVVGLYLRDPLNTQVLCSTKSSGAAPTAAINQRCQELVGGASTPLHVFSTERRRLEDTGLRLGDPVICTTNLWDHDLQNGSLGRLCAIEQTPRPVLNGHGEPAGVSYGWVDWDDGERRPITADILDALELAYAITVHKSQGSEVDTVIVPVYKSRNLDRTMLYTAVTRAKKRVLLVGDQELARQTVIAEPHASRRRVMLRNLLEQRRDAYV